jgi:uncharacterized OsmC-like protein
MSDREPTYSARSYSMGLPTRTLNTMRNHHIVLDSPGLREAIMQGEAFVAAVSSCAVAIIERRAPEMEIPLDRIEVSIDAFQNPDIVFFDNIDMHFTLYGPTQEQAEALVNRFKELCVLFRTISAATTVNTDVIAQPA